MSAEERRSAEPFDRNHRPADSSRVHDAQIREETAHDASTQATSILNQLISNLPSVPKSRDELLQQIAVVEKNLGGFYGDLVNEAERTYPSQVETLRRIRNEAIEKIDAIRHNLTPALEQAREQVGNIGKWPGDVSAAAQAKISSFSTSAQSKASELSSAAQAKVPVLGTLQAQATNVLSNIPATHLAWAPSVDLLDSGNSYLVFIELPGVDMSRISAKVSGGNTLVIEGTTEATSYEGTRILNERRTGKFSRYITLPEAVKGEPMAMMDRGVLQVEVAKAGKGAQAAA